MSKERVPSGQTRTPTQSCDSSRKLVDKARCYQLSRWVDTCASPEEQTMNNNYNTDNKYQGIPLVTDKDGNPVTDTDKLREVEYRIIEIQRRRRPTTRKPGKNPTGHSYPAILKTNKKLLHVPRRRRTLHRTRTKMRSDY